MIDANDLPASVQTILVTRLDALGDIVLGSMLLSGLHAKWPEAKIRLLVRPQMTGVAALLPDWVEVLPLPFDPRQSFVGDEPRIVELLASFSAELKPDLAIAGEYNRTWAGEIVAELCRAQAVLAFDGPSALTAVHRPIRSALGGVSLDRWKSVHVDADDREPAKYITFLNALGLEGARHTPFIVVRDEDRLAAAALWEQTGIDPTRAVVCFPSSSDQLVRSLDAPAWSRWIARLRLNRPVVLLGADADQPAIDAIEKCGLPQGVKRVIVPAANIGLTAAFLERGGAYVGMDTGPMHIAAVLGRPTLGVFGGGYRAERFLPVGRRTAAIRMRLGCYGCGWLCPFDTRICIKELPEWPICEAGDDFLSDNADNPNPFTPRIFDIQPPPGLPTVLLGPIMRQHRRFLDFNHQLIEHHDYLARVSAAQQAKLEELTRLGEDVAQQNHERGQAMAQLSAAISEMTRRNESRDGAIAHLSATLAEMTRQNEGRDQSIDHLHRMLTEMTLQNGSRDTAIAHLSATLAEMTRQNEARDQAISHLNGLQAK